MRKPLIPALLLLAYSALLIRLMVFKIAQFNLGPLRFRFAPDSGDPNFAPFSTILSYLTGHPGWLIAILNLVGNIALLVPVGVLAPLVHPKLTWRGATALAFAAPLAIEGLEVAFGVGIFDIDDVILNALGVMIGYWLFAIVFRRKRPV